MAPALLSARDWHQSSEIFGIEEFESKVSKLTKRNLGGPVMKKMNLVKVAAIVVTTGVISAAVAQTTPAPATGEQVPATTAVDAPPMGASTSEALKQADAPTTASNITAGVAMLNGAGYYDRTKADETKNYNILYLNVGYKMSPDWKITASQRLRYDVANESSAQKKVYDQNLRLNLTQSNLKLFGSEGGILYRFAPATQENARNNARQVLYVLVNPSFTWKTGSPFDVSYDLAYQTQTYGSAISRNAADGVETDYGTSFRRQWHAVSNSGAITYNIGDAFNIYQKVGHTMEAANRTKAGEGEIARTGFAPHGHWADLETGINLAATKQIAFNLYASQSHALTQSADVAGLGLDGTQYQGFMPFRPEQTSYELVTSVSF